MLHTRRQLDGDEGADAAKIVTRHEELLIADWGLLIADWGLLIADWGLLIAD
jgi:hypothetical protein